MVVVVAAVAAVVVVAANITALKTPLSIPASFC
ncbi:hypothetical protein L8106_29220 [Lyngbya sp. PCC 8106]|nr:hypothetical protein L8106_29220 [Lyngbya sp. PCC 8106]